MKHAVYFFKSVKIIVNNKYLYELIKDMLANFFI